MFYTDDVKGDYERIKARGGDVLNQRLISSKALVEAAGGLLSPHPHSPPACGWGLFIQASVMTSADSLLLLLRPLDEIERKLDRIMEVNGV